MNKKISSAVRFFRKIPILYVRLRITENRIKLSIHFRAAGRMLKTSGSFHIDPGVRSIFFNTAYGFTPSRRLPYP